MPPVKPESEKSESPPRTFPMAPIVAYISLAVAISAQAGTAIWWAGIQTARITQLEEHVEELRDANPVTVAQLVGADRQIAVIEERISNILERLDRIAEALDALLPLPQ